MEPTGYKRLSRQEVTIVANPKKNVLFERFGPLSAVMLNGTELSPIWRISFVANFFTVPVYKTIQERFSISRPEFVILFSLSQQPNLAARDICLVTGLPKNSISRAVSTLIQAGYVNRVENNTNKREKKLSLSADGQAIVKKIVPLLESRQTAMYDALDDTEKQLFKKLITKMIAHMPSWIDKN